MKNGEPITRRADVERDAGRIGAEAGPERMVITGNASSANQFTGLNTLVNTGYVDADVGRRCSAMDSIVVNWGSHVMAYALNGTHDLVDYLIDIVRRIRQRAIAGANLGGIPVGDMVLVMPSFLRDCLLDSSPAGASARARSTTRPTSTRWRRARSATR